MFLFIRDVSNSNNSTSIFGAAKASIGFFGNMVFKAKSFVYSTLNKIAKISGSNITKIPPADYTCVEHKNFIDASARTTKSKLKKSASVNDIQSPNTNESGNTILHTYSCPNLPQKETLEEKQFYTTDLRNSEKTDHYMLMDRSQSNPDLISQKHKVSLSPIHTKSYSLPVDLEILNNNKVDYELFQIKIINKFYCFKIGAYNLLGMIETNVLSSFDLIEEVKKLRSDQSEIMNYITKQSGSNNWDIAKLNKFFNPCIIESNDVMNKIEDRGLEYLEKPKDILDAKVNFESFYNEENCFVAAGNLFNPSYRNRHINKKNENMKRYIHEGKMASGENLKKLQNKFIDELASKIYLQSITDLKKENMLKKTCDSLISIDQFLSMLKSINSSSLALRSNTISASIANIDNNVDELDKKSISDHIEEGLKIRCISLIEKRNINKLVIQKTAVLKSIIKEEGEHTKAREALVNCQQELDDYKKTIGGIEGETDDGFIGFEELVGRVGLIVIKLLKDELKVFMPDSLKNKLNQCEIFNDDLREEFIAASSNMNDYSAKQHKKNINKIFSSFNVCDTLLGIIDEKNISSESIETYV